MKKKLFVSLLSVATALALAVPAMALAVGSKEGSALPAVTAPDGTQISGQVVPAKGNATLLVAAGQDDPAINAAAGTLGPNQTLLGPWKVDLVDKDTSEGVDFTELTLTFDVGTQYNGNKAIVYHSHDGVVDEYEGTVVNGKVSITLAGVSNLSMSNFAIKVGSGVVASANASSTSPKTGIDMNLMVLASGAALIAAAGVAIVARKKTQD